MAEMVALPRSASHSVIGRFVAAGHLQWAAWIFGLAFALRGIWIIFVDPDPWHDGLVYWHSANSLASGDGFRSPFFDRYTATHAPGYPLALAALFAVFGSSVVVAKLFNVVLGALTAVLVFALATKLRDQRTGIVAGGMMALFPSQIFFSTTLMAETFFVALVAVLVLLLMVWLAEQGSMKGWQVFALGLLLGFMTLVRAEVLLLAPALVVLWKLCGQSWGQVGQYLLLVVAGMAIFITPWTVRNYVRLDEFVLVRGTAESPARMVRTGLSPNYDDESGPLGSVEEPLTFGGIAERYGTQPWQLAVLGARKIEDLFGNDDPFHWIRRADYLGTTEHPPLSIEAASRWSALGNAYYYVVAVGALLSAPLWFSRRDRRLLILLWFIVSWTLVHLAFRPVLRYHFPILPVVSVLSAFALLGVWDRLEAHSGQGASHGGQGRTDSQADG